MFIATSSQIKKGLVTDVYFDRTKRILATEGIKKRVRVEFATKRLPCGWTWGILCGLVESLQLLKGIKDINVWAIEEGSVFFPSMPVLVIEGEYTRFGIYETALLGYLCQSSGVATRAARCKKTALGKSVVSFGARRMHPAIAPMIERSAFIGGCDGVATVAGAKVIGIEPTGTMPHALVLLMGGTAEAVQVFDEIIDKKVKRIALVDTFADEKFEALSAAYTLGKRLYGVRIDTAPSRRGDLNEIIKEVRWELDLRGFKHVKILVSGGMDEERIKELVESADAFGVGTALSNAPTVDFAMDIVSIDGKPIAKKGKLSGKKEVYRCPDCLASLTVKAGDKPSFKCSHTKPKQSILKLLIKNGKLQRTLPDAKKIRQLVMRQLELLSI